MRPLLDVARADTVTACLVEGIESWDDPHNDDPRVHPVRVRHTVLPVLEEELGPGVAAALARTADQLRADMDLLDELAEAAYAELRAADGALPVAELAAPAGAGPAPGAAAGRPRGRRARPPSCSTSTSLALDALLTDWRGQRWVDLPGPVRCTAVRRVAAVSAVRAARLGRRADLLGCRPWTQPTCEDDLVNVLFTEEQIQDRLRELAAEIEARLRRARTC